MNGVSAVRDFVKRSEVVGIQSTGADVVEYLPGLYNVSGSTGDPERIPGHFGKSWKQLLIQMGIGATSECYVSEPAVGAGTTHPRFTVGGHMTPNSNGSVTDGTCYLMPLCAWHNTSRRNGILFSHASTKMLRLTGYMEGELAATFQLRLFNSAPYALLYYSAGEWDYRNLSREQAADFASDPTIKSLTSAGENYVLIRRELGPETLHYVEAANLPGAASSI